MKSKNRPGANLYTATFDHSGGQWCTGHHGIGLNMSGSEGY